MIQIDFRFKLEERPPLWLMLIYGLQWLAVSVPLVIILGKTVAGMLFPGQLNLQIAYLQKTFFVTGIFLLFQIRLGHRLPLLAGPASVLLIGLAANTGAEPGAIFGSIAAGGLLLAALSLSKASTWIGSLFTVRIVGVVLLLIAFTMLPVILRLLTIAANPFMNLSFAFILVAAMLAGHRALPGRLNSMLALLSLTVGSGAYFFAGGSWPQTGSSTLEPWTYGIPDLAIDPGVLISFLFCYAALWVNDLGSIQATAALVTADEPARRLKAGLTLTGLGNVLAGMLGVIGPVNYSLSAGLISASRCASRYTLVPCAAGLMLLALTPDAIRLLAAVPSAVVGSLLLYMMGSQMAAGFGILRETFSAYRYEDGLAIGIPLLLATLLSFLPAEAVLSMPALVRPLLANGFVMGTTAALLLEHIVFRQR